MSNVVLVVDENGDTIGSMGIAKAKKEAQDRGLDLVRVGKDNNVYKIMDLSKSNYNRKKNKKHNKQIHHSSGLKTFKFSVRIGDHDLKTKVEKIKSLIAKSHPIKIEFVMKGQRERAHADMALEKLNSILDTLEVDKSLTKISQSSSVISTTIKQNMVKTIVEK